MKQLAGKKQERMERPSYLASADRNMLEDGVSTFNVAHSDFKLVDDLFNFKELQN